MSSSVFSGKKGTNNIVPPFPLDRRPLLFLWDVFLRSFLNSEMNCFHFATQSYDSIINKSFYFTFSFPLAYTWPFFTNSNRVTGRLDGLTTVRRRHFSFVAEAVGCLAVSAVFNTVPTYYESAATLRHYCFHFSTQSCSYTVFDKGFFSPMGNSNLANWPARFSDLTLGRRSWRRPYLSGTAALPSFENENALAYTYYMFRYIKNDCRGMFFVFSTFLSLTGKSSGRAASAKT